MSRGDSSREESRTAAIGKKRARANAGEHTRSRHPGGYQDPRDFVPRGGTFGLSSLPDPQIPSNPSYHIDPRSDVSESSSDYQIPQAAPVIFAMNWNNSTQGSIRTSLRGGGDLGQNRLATGFRSQPERTSIGPVSSQEVVEISDDSEVEDDSEGGILLNVDAPSRIDSSVDAETPVEIPDGEDGEIEAIPSTRDVEAGKQCFAPKSHQNVTQQSLGQNKSKITSPMFQTDAGPRSRILADLNPEDLQKQIKYTLFSLPRDQIDLSRPVICVSCLSEGHSDRHCPGLICFNCGGQTKHSSRLCSKRARCSKCGDRGHIADTCKSKLKNATLEPCDFCGGTDHIESSCTERFFPARTEIPEGELQLWISCAQCGSKDHLAGDCGSSSSRPANAWSLRAYSRNHIVNLSLQTGAQAREKEAQSKGIRPEGMQIKGREAQNRNKYAKRGEPPQFSGMQFEDDDDFTTRLAGNRSRRPSPPRNHIRFDDDDRGRMSRRNDDDYYRPRSNRPGPSEDYNDYYQPSPHEYRHRDGYGEGRGYQEDRGYQSRRPRSRSPPRFDGDTWRPPLPRGTPPPVSLPARPAPPRSQQRPQNQNQNLSRKGKRGAGKAKGNGGGGTAVKPMPSAAKNAWNRWRP